MECLPNYDNWKTKPPEDEAICYCSICGCEMYVGDALYTIDGGICEDCLNDNYREIL